MTDDDNYTLTMPDDPERIYNDRLFGRVERPYMYYLDADKNPQPCFDTLEWAAKRNGVMESVVKKTYTHLGEISTVFLGLDHNHKFQGPPVLFETMVFGGPLDQEQARYCTWAEAEIGHDEMKARVMEWNTFIGNIKWRIAIIKEAFEEWKWLGGFAAMMMRIRKQIILKMIAGLDWLAEVMNTEGHQRRNRN